ncbi:MAG: InlB B-repeat-containing protein [Clostridium sp.]
MVSWDKTLSKEVIDANSKVDGLYITTDYVAVFGEDENRDKIPDEYQVKVTYEAVNGSVSIAETYVTLYKDGHYATKAEGGVGYLTEDQIAEATANAGYNQASESWKPEKPEAGVTKITTVTNYVITFTENAAVRISYSPDDAEHGSVSPEGEEVKPATGTPVGSTATAKDGWAFKHWTKDGEIVSWDRNLSKEVIDANSKDANDLYVESGYVAVFGEDKNKDNIRMIFRLFLLMWQIIMEHLKELQASIIISTR